MQTINHICLVEGLLGAHFGEFRKYNLSRQIKRVMCMSFWISGFRSYKKLVSIYCTLISSFQSWILKPFCYESSNRTSYTCYVFCRINDLYSNTIRYVSHKQSHMYCETVCPVNRLRIRRLKYTHTCDVLYPTESCRLNIRT